LSYHIKDLEGSNFMAQEGFKRKLTAILSADVAGYSRLMGEDEEATIRTLIAYREVMNSLIKQHRGRVVDSPGDNLMAEFPSVVDAVQCAVAVQKEFQSRNAELPENRRMEFRIGINLGDVIEEKDLIYGDGVNIAARLESLADPGGICVSKTAFDHIESKLPYGYVCIGSQTVKNITKPIVAYKVLLEPRITVAREKKKIKAVQPKRKKSVIVGVILAFLVIVGVGLWYYSWISTYFSEIAEKTEENGKKIIKVGGNKSFYENSDFKGKIGGNVIVSKGITVRFWGTIGGNVTLEPGAILEVHGKIGGNVFNKGGKLRLDGKLGGNEIYLKKSKASPGNFND
jgi:class 3 adenylate cyclase